MLSQALLRSFLFRRLVFRYAQARTALRGVSVRLRWLSSRGKLANALGGEAETEENEDTNKKQALDTRTCSLGAGDRGRTGTVSLPSDFESDTSANSITPAHNIMIIAYFFHFVKQTASKFCIYSFVYFQHKTYLTTLDFWRFL